MRRNIKTVSRLKSWLFEYDNYIFELNIIIITVSLAFLFGLGK